jgi:hypothetical protein
VVTRGGGVSIIPGPLLANALWVRVTLPYEPVVGTVVAALEEEGTSALTELDVRATREDKLGAESCRCIIVGACDPAFGLSGPACGLADPVVLAPRCHRLPARRGDAKCRT